MRYPHKIRVKDTRMEKIMDRLVHDRTVTIEGDKSITMSFGKKIKPIRKDFFIGFDQKYYTSNISIANPFVKIEKKDKDYIFKM